MEEEGCWSEKRLVLMRSACCVGRGCIPLFFHAPFSHLLTQILAYHSHTHVLSHQVYIVIQWIEEASIYLTLEEEFVFYCSVQYIQ